MKFIITAITLCIVALASADVSHLNNEYLPPHSPGGSAHHHHHDQHDQGHQSQISQVVTQGEESYESAGHEAQASYQSPQAAAENEQYYAPQAAAAAENEQYYAEPAAEPVAADAVENEQYYAAPAAAPVAAAAAENEQYYAPAEGEVAGEQPAAAGVEYTFDNSITSAGYEGDSNGPASGSDFGTAAQNVAAQYVAQGTTHEHVHAHHGGQSSSGIDTKYGSNGGYVY